MQQMCTTKLADAERGIHTVTAVHVPSDPHVLRLCQLGLVPGEIIELLRVGKNGTPFLVRVNHVVLCLDASLARHFVVEKAVQS